MALPPIGNTHVAARVDALPALKMRRQSSIPEGIQARKALEPRQTFNFVIPSAAVNLILIY